MSKFHLKQICPHPLLPLHPCLFVCLIPTSLHPWLLICLILSDAMRPDSKMAGKVHHSYGARDRGVSCGRGFFPPRPKSKLDNSLCGLVCGCARGLFGDHGFRPGNSGRFPKPSARPCPWKDICGTKPSPSQSQPAASGALFLKLLSSRKTPPPEKKRDKNPDLNHSLLACRDDCSTLPLGLLHRTL